MRAPQGVDVLVRGTLVMPHAIYISRKGHTLATFQRGSGSLVPRVGDTVRAGGTLLLVLRREWCYNTIDDGGKAFLTLYTKPYRWYRRLWDYLCAI